MGKILLERILKRDIDHGGRLVEITGAMGTSKTGCLLAFITHTLRLHPEEKIFFREQTNAPLQIYKLRNKYQVFIQKGADVTFRDRNEKLKEIEVGAIEFTNFQDLWKKSKPGVVSVPFFKEPYDWMEFMTFLREVGEWVNVFVDEMADICPGTNSGALYKRMNEFSKTAGAFRRCMMNVFYNTQSVSDVDWRVRKKVMVYIYFRGARPDKKSRVTQKAIDGLEINHKKGNEAYIDYSGEFGKVRFTDIFHPDHRFHIEAHVPQKTKQEMEAESDE